MTFVGKILVILIMAFSLVFLGVSTVVFSTATNWKDKSTKQAEDIKKLQGQLRDAQTKVTAAEGQLKTAKEEHAKQIEAKDRMIVELDTKIKEAADEKTVAVTQLEVAQKNAQVSLAEATARKGEIDVLNVTLGKAQTQANQFSEQNIVLKDQIRVLEREKGTAEQNAKDLRSVVGRFMTYIRLKNIPYEAIEKLDATAAPPPVEGKVVALNPTRRSMEISIGSDDGLAVGQELYVFRLVPRQDYIGKVKIVSVYPDQAVAEVIGNTVGGKKIQEGDIVSSTLVNSR